jgi:hypothetical protein
MTDQIPSVSALNRRRFLGTTTAGLAVAGCRHRPRQPRRRRAGAPTGFLDHRLATAS